MGLYQFYTSLRMEMHSQLSIRCRDEEVVLTLLNTEKKAYEKLLLLNEKL